jgi:hypothetical protein
MSKQSSSHFMCAAAQSTPNRIGVATFGSHNNYSDEYVRKRCRSVLSWQIETPQNVDWGIPLRYFPNLRSICRRISSRTASYFAGSSIGGLGNSDAMPGRFFS